VGMLSGPREDPSETYDHVAEYHKEPRGGRYVRDRLGQCPRCKEESCEQEGAYQGARYMSFGTAITHSQRQKKCHRCHAGGRDQTPHSWPRRTKSIS
jgi:hypothetical protein